MHVQQRYSFMILTQQNRKNTQENTHHIDDHYIIQESDAKFRAGFHNNSIRLNFNAKMSCKTIYFRQIYQI